MEIQKSTRSLLSITLQSRRKTRYLLICHNTIRSGTGVVNKDFRTLEDELECDGQKWDGRAFPMKEHS